MVDTTGAAPDAAMSGLAVAEFEAGPDHVIVVYTPPDSGAELDPVWIFSEVARDAAARAERGLRLLSMVSMPLRHSGAWVGRDGSGFETKVALAVVYERWAGVGGS